MGLFRSSDGIHFNPLWHSFSLLLTLISFILLMIVVFYNAPIDHVHSTLEGKVGLRMWFLTINETSSSFPTWTIGTKRYYDAAEGEMPGKGIGLAAPASNEERAADIGAVSDGALHAYGFGIWGWCEWTSSKWMGDAVCTRKTAYKLPNDSDNRWDSIYELELPYAVTHVLSGTAIPILIILSYLIILCLAILFPGPYPPWPVPRKHPPEVKYYSTRCAWLLRDWRFNLYYFLAMLALGLSMVVTVQELGLESWACWVYAQMLCMWKTGLIMRHEGKDRTKYSKG
ncbi:hypothetical protein I307_06054 [Cryptococcus deuterogattii 99/473]|uniref:Unplaced genomic scaffold supercont1.19, whole genome shotgun sequence n=1 Tax=Cryptococcus deuterogattii Ram5 TaxID=1296110 RepID=A0A0D0TQI2_9TREE|nr:hypothetical protein I309_05054 [Cryptococcus deuterogattii LA55]KIR37668.1 hypothetical protein I313_06392 [Cryptococcus deuterogattii Ram5]KIR70280.1 hypothetical protein I310_05907 [Cryptococcus deuterogattii CA1014]KIR89833.1 hypothetical protein I304_06352 [Cryptococcus deuterogattii CBS 10090]KIY54579.1 hypothetical protein I307_06054 [Cryptococcus deuterogattii 99/473]